MARKIKFPLEMADGASVRDLEELREHFNLEKCLEYLLDGKLQRWLEDRYYMEEAEKLANLDMSDIELRIKLCRILGVAEIPIDDGDAEKFRQKASRLEQLKQYTSDREIWKK